MKMKTSLLRLRRSTLPAVLSAAMALAQVPAGAQPSGPLNEALDEITVTAQRRSEVIQDVPIMMSAFNAEEIENAGIRTTQDFIELVPNVSLDDSFTYLNTFVVVRGVTQINNADSPIAIVIDGVPQNNQKQLKMNLFDIEQIEVLKGPQGALYGRNAIGGAINIVTRDPSEQFESYGALGYANGGNVEVRGVLSGPVAAEKASVSLAGFYTQANGLIDNTFLGTAADFIDHDYTVRGKLLVRPNETVDLDLRASFSDFAAGGVYDAAAFSGNANDSQLPTTSLLGRTEGDIAELTFKADVDMTFARLTAITGYTDLYEQYRGDLDFSNPVEKPGGFLGFLGPVGQGQNLSVELLSQEIRLTSPDEDRFRWIAGAYYLHADRTLVSRAFFDMTGRLDQFENGVLLADLGESTDGDAWSLFGQTDYDVSDRLILSLAVRYDRDERAQADLNSPATAERSFDAWQPKLTATYHLSEQALAYATYGTGFRSGGFNLPGLPGFEDEYLQNFEIGTKTGWLEDRLVLNAAVFYSISDDFQYFFFDAARAAQVIANLDEVHIRGVELDFRARPAAGWDIYGGIGTTDTSIEESSARPDVIGNRTPKTTRWSLNLGSQYRFDIIDGIEGLVRLDYRHAGDKYWQIDNLDVQDPVDILDARFILEGDRWSFAVWGKNLTDEKYYADFNPKEFAGLDVDIGFPAQPRSFGVELAYRQ